MKFLSQFTVLACSTTSSLRKSVWLGALCIGLLEGCTLNRTVRIPDANDTLRADLLSASSAELQLVPFIPAPILQASRPVDPPVPEAKLDLLVNNAQARDVFLAIVADTRYSLLMHPDVTGSLSVTLRGLTIKETLEAIRDVYGYDFKIEGRRITIYGPSLQTRIFTVNYPQSQRLGSSELRVSPGSALQSGASGRSASSPGLPVTNTGQQADGSRVLTTTKTDFWAELAGAAKGLIGDGAGRSVITSPQAGIIAVRAMPDELRQVDQFLKAAQIAVERQVMLEAKIVEVELRDGFQSGIDWSALASHRNAIGALGVVSGNAGNNALINGIRPGLPGFAATGSSGSADGISLPSPGSGLFGLAFAASGFQAVLGFLETQGDIQILSSPRIATLNNQKAVLKVGVEDFFVTNVSGGTAATSSLFGSSGGTTLPSLTLTPFFSGISLDVTPQIDESTNITLHVHPSVTFVTEKTKQVDLGSIGNYRLPLASSSVNETDTLVRIQDGNIVAIGGLMQIQSSRGTSGLPGTAGSPLLSTLLGNQSSLGRKKEVVVLLKPTIIRTLQDWEAQTRRSRLALDDMAEVKARVVRMDGSLDTKAKPFRAGTN